jgi:periplasmic protein TonB
MSIVLHALALFLVLVPAVASVSLAIERQSWGKRGFVLGGGGGARPERLQYVQVAPPPPPTIHRPVVRRPPPKPEPRVMTPPVIPPPPTPPPPAPVIDSAADGVTPGAGKSGAGPGTGGGTGSGKGPGTGAGTGPGTAGDPAARKLRAMAPETIVAGLDAPKDARPRHLVAVFIVAPTGDAKLVSFTQTNDGGLNRRLKDEFEQMTRSRWQPAALDGVSVPDTVSYVVELP